MTAQEMQAQIDALAVQLANLREEIAPAIAEGLRLFADRPPGEKGSPSLQFGRVEQVEDTYAYVTLDGQTDAVPINMLGGLVVGERVAVLLVPPSGNLAIGMVSPAVVGSLPPGGAAAQVLTKIDATDGNADWETPSAGGGGFPVGPETDAFQTYIIELRTDDGYYASFRATNLDDPTQVAQFHLNSFDAELRYADGTATASVEAQAQTASLTAHFDDVSVDFAGAQVFSQAFNSNSGTADGPRRASHSVMNASAGSGGALRMFAVGDATDANQDVGVEFDAAIFMRPIATPRLPDDIDLSADTMMLYAFDNGGSIELRAKFANGTVVTLATD